MCTIIIVEYWLRGDLMDLKGFFADIGYNIDVFLDNQSRIMSYISWYYGVVENFHRYYIYNGEHKVFRDRYSLHMPKCICESFANLICNEKTKIHLSNENANKILDDILDVNNFYLRLNQSIEKVFALGFGAFVVSFDESKINIQFVTCDKIIPLRYDHNYIYECAFVNDTYDFNGDFVRFIQIHHKDDKDQYVIDNYKFIVGASGELNPFDEDKYYDIPRHIETYSDIPWFTIVRPNCVNNLDINSPFGLPVYANCLDIIKGLDIIYDSFVNEIQNGRKRLFVTSEALKVNSRGCLKDAFDPNDVVFYLLDNNNDSENKNKYVQEVNGELRINELRLALQTNLEVLSNNLGLGKDYFHLGNDYKYGLKTATEVISSNSDLYRTIHKHEILFESSLRQLVNIIQFISKNVFGVNIDGDIFVDFDDSIIESDASKREQDRKDVEMGAMSLAEYRSIWYDEPLELAQEHIQEAKNEKEQNNIIEKNDNDQNPIPP